MLYLPAVPGNIITITCDHKLPLMLRSDFHMRILGFMVLGEQPFSVVMDRSCRNLSCLISCHIAKRGQAREASACEEKLANNPQ